MRAQDAKVHGVHKAVICGMFHRKMKHAATGGCLREPGSVAVSFRFMQKVNRRVCTEASRGYVFCAGGKHHYCRQAGCLCIRRVCTDYAELRLSENPAANKFKFNKNKNQTQLWHTTPYCMSTASHKYSKCYIATVTAPSFLCLKITTSQELHKDSTCNSTTVPIYSGQKEICGRYRQHTDLGCVT